MNELPIKGNARISLVCIGDTRSIAWLSRSSQPSDVPASSEVGHTSVSYSARMTS